MPEKTGLFLWNNQNLFSNNYLEHRLSIILKISEQEKRNRYSDKLIDQIVYKPYDLTPEEIEIEEGKCK